MSTMTVTRISCAFCPKVAYIPKSDTDEARAWATRWHNHITFRRPDGHVDDACGTCADAMVDALVGVELLHVRSKLRDKVLLASMPHPA